MLDIMRRKKRLKIILWVVIFSLALGMLLFFVPGVNIGGVPVDATAATVDGRPVPMKEFLAAYRKTINNYSNRGRNRLDPETIKMLGIPKQVLDGMITRKVVEIIADSMGIEVTPSEVRRAIETYPYFQDQGKFIGVERYKALLAANNLSVTEFEDDMRYLQLVKKLESIFADSLDVSEKELREEFSRNTIQMQVDFVLVKKEDMKKRLKPSEEDLKAYFEGHKDAYRIKEKRRAQYLLVPVSQILPNVSASDREILEEWDQTPHEETVEAAHILFKVPDSSKDAEVKAKAEAVLKQLRAGGDFAELAKRYSEDSGSAKEGGYLGAFSRGQMVKEFEDAAFALKPGETSDLVRTEYGYHIIKVLHRETPTLENSRERLADSVRMRKAREISKQKAEDAARLAQKQKDLSSVAKSLRIPTEIKETPPFANDSSAFELNITEAFRNEVFQLKEINAVGKAVEFVGGYAVPKLIEVQMPKPGEFNQSRAQVEKDYLEFKAKELVQQQARKLAEEAAKQRSLENVAKAMGFSVKTSQLFKLSESPHPEITNYSAFNSAVFELDPGDVGGPIPLLDDFAVFQVKSRSPFDEQAYEKEKATLRKNLLASKQDAYFQDYLRKITEDLEKAGKIRINPKALEISASAVYY